MTTQWYNGLGKDALAFYAAADRPHRHVEGDVDVAISPHGLAGQLP